MAKVETVKAEAVRCPHCGGTNHQCVHTARVGDIRVQYRNCARCEKTFKLETDFETQKEGNENMASRNFSLANMIRKITMVDQSKGGFEVESANRAAKEMHAQGEYLIPGSCLARTAMTTSTDSGLVPTQARLDNSVPWLYDNSFLGKLPVLVLDNLRPGDVKIGRTSQARTPSWIVEGVGEISVEAAESAAVTLTPKLCGTFCDISLALLKAQPGYVEGYLRRELGAALAGAVETAVFGGTGADGQPTGLFTNSDISTLTTGTGIMDWAKIVSMHTSVAENSGIQNPDGTAFITTPTQFGEWAKKEKITGSGRFILDDGKAFNSPCYHSKGIPETLGAGSAHGAAFGDFSQLAIAVWGEGPSITLNPFTLGNQAIVRCFMWQAIDIGFLQPKSFVKVADLAIAST